jgi:uncharacterized protein YbjT (DUF2867 family)
MAEKKTILVTGATGAQGGGVAKHLLKNGRYTVRCLTRNPSSDKANALKLAGAEVRRGDLDDPASLREALEGCWGVFGVTNFWEHFAKELPQGINLVDAVTKAKVPHFIFSTLPYVKKLTGGKLEVPHFDLKGQIEEHARGLKLGATFANVAFYFENFIHFFPPRKQVDGSYALAFPQGDTPLATVAVEDAGGVVETIFRDPDSFKDKTVGVVGDDLPCVEYAAILSKVTGKKVVYSHMPREQFAALGFPGADDLANMFEYNRFHIPNRQADVRESLRLYPAMQRFEPWARANRARLLEVLK